jgi:hypothetical protein
VSAYHKSFTEEDKKLKTAASFLSSVLNKEFQTLQTDVEKLIEAKECVDPQISVSKAEDDDLSSTVMMKLLNSKDKTLEAMSLKIECLESELASFRKNNDEQRKADDDTKHVSDESNEHEVARPAKETSALESSVSTSSTPAKVVRRSGSLLTVAEKKQVEGFREWADRRRSMGLPGLTLHPEEDEPPVVPHLKPAFSNTGSACEQDKEEKATNPPVTTTIATTLLKSPSAVSNFFNQ